MSMEEKSQFIKLKKIPFDVSKLILILIVQLK